jgi:hypothetical protein
MSDRSTDFRTVSQSSSGLAGLEGLMAATTYAQATVVTIAGVLNLAGEMALGWFGMFFDAGRCSRCK